MIPRLPVSVTSSMVLHGAILVFIANPGVVPKPALRVIGNVDLLIPAPRRPAAAPSQAPVKPPSTLDFLKMALPSLPKIISPVRPAALDVKLPEIRRAPIAPLEEPKLEDRGRLKTAPKIEALDLGKKRVEAARVEGAPIDSRRSKSALLEAPRLEEVGRRKVSDLPAAIALEEKRREAVDMKRMEALVPQFPTRKAPAQAMAVLREATPSERARLGDRLETFAPHPGLQLAPERVRPQDVPPLAKKLPVAEPAPARRPARAELAETPKSGVEIEGPLKNRKVAYYEIPEFPAWARDQGIMEASVAIRFTVSREGEVLPGMRVEQTSGYGRLDRLAMESLKKWRFVPGAAEDRQWGVITFRFILE